MSDTTEPRMARVIGRAIVLVAAGGLLGCPNAGDDRVLGIGATALVRGGVFLDENGDRIPNLAPAGPDAPLQGVRVRLVPAGTRDTAAAVTSGSDGTVAFGNVPVGRYLVVVLDEALFGDSLEVVRVDTADLSLAAGDTVDVVVTVSYPIVSIAEARASAVGRKVFVQGVTLNARATFGDATVHLADTSGALRVTDAGGPVVAAGDSVRVLGRIASLDGQPVLDQGFVTLLRLVGAPSPMTVVTALAASADGGALDAALVRVVDVLVSDSATVQGEYHLTVDDGSGPLTVVFDQDAGLTRTPYVPDVTLDVTGVLVPAPGGAGGWQLKPRVNGDVVLK